MLVRIKIEPATWVNWNNIAFTTLQRSEGAYWFDMMMVSGDRVVSEDFQEQEQAFKWLLKMQEVVAMGNGG